MTVLQQSAQGIEDGQVGFRDRGLLHALAARDRRPPGPFQAREEGIDDAGLANACFAGDEQDLPVARHRLFERVLQAGEGRRATDERVASARGPAVTVRGVGQLVVDDADTRGIRDGRREAVAPPVSGFDVPRLPGVVAQQPPDVADGHFEHGVADVGVWPDGVEQLILGDDSRPLSNQIEQHGQ